MQWRGKKENFKILRRFEVFKNSTECWICDNDHVDNDTKVRDHCHITGRYKGSAHRNSNSNLKWNHKIPVVFHNLNI